MFTRDQIISFCAVYEEGSYSAAARKIGRDRSTVREHVTILEDNIGVALFEIVGRSAIPTAPAKQLFPRSIAIARQIEEFEQAALHSFEQELLTLNIYYDPIVPVSLMAHIAHKMEERHPEVQINWLQKHRQQAMDDLISRQAHLALMPIKMMVKPDKEVNYINLGRVPLSVYTGSRHTLANRENVRIAELQLSKQYIFETHFDAELQGTKISPNYSLISSNDLVIELLKQGGWAALPDEFAKDYLQLGYIKKVDCYELANTIDYNICVFFSPALEHNEVISNALSEIRDYSQRMLK